MLKTQGLSYSYAHGALLSFPDLDLGKGEQAILMGNSGSGKSTLLHLIAGILNVQKGVVNIDDNDFSSISDRTKDKMRGENIGLIFQKPLFINSISMHQNLSIAQTMPGFKVNHAYAALLMDKLGVQKLANNKPSQCSEGELQRFSIIRALINKPKLVLADEPTASLDDDNCEKFLLLLSETCAEFQTCLLVATHDNRVKKYIDKTYEL